MFRHLIGKVAFGAILAAASTSVAASATTFTWNPGAALAGLPGPFTADSMSMTDTLLNIGTVAAATDTFILQINGFSLNGQPVSVPGLGTSFGLYLEGSTFLTGNPSVYGPGSISLVLDPTNNDGTASASVNLVSQTGRIGFSNPAGTADDITLATGSLISGAFGIQPNGNPGVRFVETYTPSPGETGFSVSPTGPYVTIAETLTNTSTSRVAGTFTNGTGWITVNGGVGSASLAVPEPASMSLVGTELIALAALRRRLRSH